MAFTDLCNLHLISYDDCLIDDGEFTVLYDLDYSILEAFSSSRSFFTVFVLMFKVYTDLEQLLTSSYARFRLLREFSVAAMFSHIWSLSGILKATSCSRVHWKLVAFYTSAKNHMGKKKKERTSILWYNLECTSKHRP